MQHVPAHSSRRPPRRVVPDQALRAGVKVRGGKKNYSGKIPRFFFSKLNQILRMAELVGQSYNVMSCARCMSVNPCPEHPHNHMS